MAGDLLRQVQAGSRSQPHQNDKTSIRISKRFGLLIIFAVIAEEQSVTKASARLLLSQPAVSRALQRARSMFQDELVVRSSSGFELTLRGRKILQELEQLLPKIEGLVVPNVFDPKRERSNFRISGADNVCIALLPHLCHRPNVIR